MYIHLKTTCEDTRDTISGLCINNICNYNIHMSILHRTLHGLRDSCLLQCARTCLFQIQDKQASDTINLHHHRQMAKPRTTIKHDVYYSRDDCETFIRCVVTNGANLGLQKYHTKK